MLQQTHAGRLPAEACQLLDAVSAWWRIQLDPLSTSLRCGVQSKVESAIAATRAWTVREPLRAEAWFYLGGAYGARVQWWCCGGDACPLLATVNESRRRWSGRWPSTREWRTRISDSVSISTMPMWRPRRSRCSGGSCCCPAAIGSRNGSRCFARAALASSCAARSSISCTSSMCWYEKQPARAARAARPISARAILTIPILFRQWPRSRTSTSTTPPRAFARGRRYSMRLERGQVAKSQLAEANARLGIASQLDQLSQRRGGLEHLHAVIASQPTAPFDAVARAQLQLGQTLEHLGRRDEAAAAYRAAISAAGRNDPLKIAPRARASLRAIERSSRATTTSEVRSRFIRHYSCRRARLDSANTNRRGVRGAVF